jgi:hypothetical protein
VLKGGKKMADKQKQIPVGVMILSILGYIGAVLTLLGGLALIFGASFIASFLAQMIPMMGAGVTSAWFIILGIIVIALAILDYFIARGLWNGQNWARILVIIFTALSLLSSLMHPLSGIVSIVIDVLIIWYLGFNKQAVDYFK